MNEYEILNKETNEHDYIYGYWQMDAWRRAEGRFSPDEWTIINTTYID